MSCMSTISILRRESVDPTWLNEAISAMRWGQMPCDVSMIIDGPLHVTDNAITSCVLPDPDGPEISSSSPRRTPPLSNESNSSFPVEMYSNDFPWVKFNAVVATNMLSWERTSLLPGSRRNNRTGFFFLILSLISFSEFYVFHFDGFFHKSQNNENRKNNHNHYMYHKVPSIGSTHVRVSRVDTVSILKRAR